MAADLADHGRLPLRPLDARVIVSPDRLSPGAAIFRSTGFHKDGRLASTGPGA